MRVERVIKCLAVVAELVKQMGVLKGRVRLQKMMYLLKQRSVTELEGEFTHRPFSQLVADAVDSGVWESVLIEEKDFDHQTIRYKPGTEIHRYPLEATTTRKEIEFLIDATKDVQWDVLELAANIHYSWWDAEVVSLPFYERELLESDPNHPEAIQLLQKLHLWTSYRILSTTEDIDRRFGTKCPNCQKRFEWADSFLQEDLICGCQPGGGLKATWYIILSSRDSLPNVELETIQDGIGSYAEALRILENDIGVQYDFFSDKGWVSQKCH